MGKVIDGPPEKFTLFDFEISREDIWCIQYSRWEKDFGKSGPSPSYAVFISKETGKILFQGCLSDEG